MKTIDECLQKIENVQIREQCQKVFEKVSPDFFVEAASSTGKYHPSYALGNGGLVRHTIAAFMIADDLLNLDSYKEMFNSEFRDYIRAAILLHDTCKRGINFESKYTVHEHPILVKQLCEMVLGTCTFTTIVGELVASHMGQWNINRFSSVVLPLPNDEAKLFVHTCDYLASRKYLEVSF